MTDRPDLLVTATEDDATNSSGGIDPFVISLPKPAEGFTQAYLLGNGALGATVYGRTGYEDFDLNLDTLWSGGPTCGRSDDAGDVIALRDAIRRDDAAAADAHARALQSEEWSQSYQPLGRLRWRWGGEGDGPYVRQIHLRDAETVTQRGGDSLTAIVSAPDEVLVAWTDGTGDGDLEFSTVHEGAEIVRRDQDGVAWMTATGRAPVAVLPDYEEDADPVLYANDGPAEDGTAEAGMGWALVAAVSNDADGVLRLVAAGTTGFRGYRERPSVEVAALAAEAELTVRAALARSVNMLRERHRADVHELVDRVRLDLTASTDAAALEAERYFNVGRYLLIASSRPGTQAAALQGIWNVDTRPVWSGNYTTNINVQMNYWGAEAAGLADLHEPLFTLTEDLAVAGAETARSRYGAPGAAVHHNSDIWRFTEPVKGEPQWSNWATALPWLVSHLTQHSLFGGCVSFARERELPVLREAVRFLEWALVDDGTGALVASPSSAPENLFVAADGGSYAVTAGATMDQELALESFGRYVELAQSAGADEEFAAHIERLLRHVRRPQIDGRGRLEEWAGGRRPQERGHRHLSHLYGVYPGSRITSRATPDEFAAARAAFDERLEWGSAHTGWSGAWIVALAARFGDRDLAAWAIDKLVHDLSSISLLDLCPHAEWPGGSVFQIDGNLGAVGAMVELVLQGHDGALSLLPALPVGWDAGEARGLRALGGYAVDLNWRGARLERATVRPSRDGEIALELDDLVRIAEITVDGELVEPKQGDDAGPGRRRWRVAGRAGRPTVVTVA